MQTFQEQKNKTIKSCLQEKDPQLTKSTFYFSLAPSFWLLWQHSRKCKQSFFKSLFLKQSLPDSVNNNLSPKDCFLSPPHWRTIPSVHNIPHPSIFIHLGSAVFHSFASAVVSDFLDCSFFLLAPALYSVRSNLVKLCGMTQTTAVLWLCGFCFLIELLLFALWDK